MEDETTSEPIIHFSAHIEDQIPGPPPEDPPLTPPPITRENAYCLPTPAVDTEREMFYVQLAVGFALLTGFVSGVLLSNSLVEYDAVRVPAYSGV